MKATPMKLRIKVVPYLLLIALVMPWGCPIETPEAQPDAGTLSGMDLLRGLTAMQERTRFDLLETAKKNIDQLAMKDIESALTTLRQKNVSTLIYVFMETKNKRLYQLGPPARRALENSAGSFPNIAYYYARVNPAAGLPALLRLYEQQPKYRLAICLALGEVCQSDAGDFLLTQARHHKRRGEDITPFLSGLKTSCSPVKTEALDWFLKQNLNREELIALSEMDLALPPARLKEFWQAGGQRRFFSIQVILDEPDTHFEVLEWLIAQYLDAGDTETIEQWMHSDSMQAATAKRVIVLRESTLKKIRRPATGPAAPAN
jgi:hypothetical protein